MHTFRCRRIQHLIQRAARGHISPQPLPPHSILLITTGLDINPHLMHMHLTCGSPTHMSNADTRRNVAMYRHFAVRISI